LRPEHVYTLLEAHEDHGVWLLRLRDPQKTSEWKGCRTPEVCARLGCTADSAHETGVILVELEDFLQCFQQLDVCEVRGLDWHEQRLSLAPTAGLEVAAVEASACVVSLCIPYTHAQAEKCTLWLALLRIEMRQPPEEVSATLLSRTRFTRESTCSLEFSLGAGEACVLVPFRIVPSPEVQQDNRTPVEGTWACFSKQPVRCDICHLTPRSYAEIEDASAQSHHWRDHGKYGLVGDAASWGDPMLLTMVDVRR